MDAPVSGTGQVAWNGELTVMVGGEDSYFKQIEPILDAVSLNAQLIGPVGSGNIAKLINNMVNGWKRGVIYQFQVVKDQVI